MREDIKFRAWIPDDGSESGYIMMDWFSLQERDQFLTEEDITVMQYTRFRDKNGVEIYEGDVVSLDNRIYPEDKVSKYVVRWENGYLRNIELNGMIENLEVIGNIFENEELIYEAEET